MKSGVVKEVKDLQNVFEHIYRYAVEEWKIPSLHSYITVRQRLNKFLDEFKDKESLLIVYYGGHGEMNDNRQCIWSWLVPDLFMLSDLRIQSLKC